MIRKVMLISARVMSQDHQFLNKNNFDFLFYFITFVKGCIIS